MADRKISELTTLTGLGVADDDKLVIVDTSADETKAITAAQLRVAIGNSAFNFTDDVIIAGDLTVNGTTTTINTVELLVEDKNVTIAYGAVDPASADGAGLTVDGANATITYINSTDSWDFNKDVTVPNLTTSGNVDGRDVSVDGAKLDGIEAGADVTDATNVAAAGAAMTANNLSDLASATTARGNLGLGTAATTAATAYATAAQGALADTATQPADLATVATTGAYADLSGKPTLGTAAATASTDYATAAQGTLADSAIQSADLATVATTGAYTDLSGTPTLGTAAFTATTAYATAAQGALADTATQPADVVAKTSGTGSAVIPTGTEAQRDGSPSAGYLRFNSDATSFEGYDGSAWGAIGGGGGGATSDFMYENAATLAENITLAAGRNGMSTGPIDIPSGLSVTIESGSRWVVI